MKFIIAGGSGFLGRTLIAELAPIASDIVLLSTSDQQVPGTRTVKWDGKNTGPWEAELERADAVINYCGAPIFARWTAEYREKIVASRVNPTLALSHAIASIKTPPAIWINGSATGFYGDRGAEDCHESDPAGQGFLAEVCQKWEEAAKTRPETKLVLLRTAVTLEEHHSPLNLLIRLTKCFAGGAIGNGQQFMPWIYAKDHARLVRHAIEHRLEGPLNAVAPHPITNGKLMEALRHALHRPWSPPVPAAVISALGHLGFPDEGVLFSTKAVPDKAIATGFTWLAPTIQDTLTELGLARR